MAIAETRSRVAPSQGRANPHQRPRASGTAPRPWWQRAVFYQVYPLSFQDSDGDGRGDLPGLAARLDHLDWLGVDAVWLGPVFPSPMRDFGYDIADFTDIDPRFGSLEAFDRLLAAVHGRGLRLVLDFVPNHTSDRHPWFLDSRSSRGSERRDWYVWADPAPHGGPPNGWLSRFGGSAWEWDATTGQYYYHAFLKEQPDLNWHNPRVREAMAEVLRFWMRRGVDGFRLDACGVLGEDPDLREDPPDPAATADTPPPDRQKRVHTNDRPEVLDWLAELRRVADEFPERVLLGEVDGAGERIARFYGDAGRPLLHLPLNYRLHETAWSAPALREAIEAYLRLVPDSGWPDWLIGGHDKKRIVDVLGPGQAAVAALLQFTLPGTPVLYQGDELGLPGLRLPSEAARDPFERRLPGYGLNRDAERAPMPWDGGRHGGFSEVAPWLPLVEDWERHGVARQRGDPRSPLALYRALIALRHTEPALEGRRLRMARRDEGPVLRYTRGEGPRRLLVLLNLGSEEQHADLPAGRALEVVLSTHLDRHRERPGPALTLRANEGVVLGAAGPRSAPSTA